MPANASETDLTQNLTPAQLSALTSAEATMLSADELSPAQWKTLAELNVPAELLQPMADQELARLNFDSPVAVACQTAEREPVLLRELLLNALLRSRTRPTGKLIGRALLHTPEYGVGMPPSEQLLRRLTRHCQKTPGITLPGGVWVETLLNIVPTHPNLNLDQARRALHTTAGMLPFLNPTEQAIILNNLPWQNPELVDDLWSVGQDAGLESSSRLLIPMTANPPGNRLARRVAPRLAPLRWNADSLVQHCAETKDGLLLDLLVPHLCDPQLSFSQAARLHHLAWTRHWPDQFVLKTVRPPAGGETTGLPERWPSPWLTDMLSGHTAQRGGYDLRNATAGQSDTGRAR